MEGTLAGRSGELLRCVAARGAFQMDEVSNRLIATLLEESDRGLVLAGAAFLDEALGDLLSAAFRTDLSKADRKSLFTHLGPLNSMSSRTIVAFALSLIDSGTRDSLDQIRAIRNHFAHFAGTAELPVTEIERLLEAGEPSLKLAVAAFGSSNDPRFSSQRVKIGISIVSLWAKIRHLTEQLGSGGWHK